jgi:hypothetical protein
VLTEIDTFDWEEAFKYAETSEHAAPAENKSARPGFTREDVAEILFLREGANDEENWVGVFRLHDGRYAYLSAGCDFTGWG